MKAAKGILTGLILVLASSTLTASGPIGIYGVVEKVVFEPNEQSPERIQIWGAFAHADGYGGGDVGVIRRGYFYFRLPARDLEPAKKEWLDLKAVAGTGQAVGFGNWLNIVSFRSFDPDKVSSGMIYLPQGGLSSGVDLRIRSESETPSAPAIYSTNAGLVKLANDGNRADLVKRLKEALKK